MRRILVATDFSRTSSAAASVGFNLASAHDAELCLYHATGVIDHAAVPAEIAHALRETRASQVHRDLLELRDQLENRGKRLPAIQIAIRHAEPAVGIRSYAREWNPDLIVMGSHGDGERSFMLGSVAMAVARGARCPVLISREHHRDRLPADGKFRQPLVAIDHSPFSVPAVRLAARLSADDATLELVHIYYSPENAEALSLARTEELERLSELAARVDVAPLRVETRAEAGRVASHLLDLIASSSYDLVVAGAHGRRGAGATLGTVADRLLRGSAAPVLIIPEAALALDVDDLC